MKTPVHFFSSPFWALFELHFLLVMALPFPGKTSFCGVFRQNGGSPKTVFEPQIFSPTGGASAVLFHYWVPVSVTTQTTVGFFFSDDAFCWHVALEFSLGSTIVLHYSIFLASLNYRLFILPCKPSLSQRSVSDGSPGRHL